MKIPPERKRHANEEEIELAKLNKIAYSTLILSCRGIAFSIVEGAVTNDLPSGDAGLAWERLKSKHQVEGMATMVELRRKFTQSRLKVGEDPDKWFMNLEHIRNRMSTMGNEITDQELIAHVLANIPDKHSELVTALEGDLETLDVPSLQERVKTFYRRKALSTDYRSRDDVALVGAGRTGLSGAAFVHNFKGRCNKCGKYGHKASVCKDTVEKRKETSRIVCHFCKKPGHVMSRCFKKKFDEKSKKANRGEDIALVVSNEGQKWNQEKWYADSGASRHMTNSMTGLMKVQRGINEKIMIGDGTVVCAHLHTPPIPTRTDLCM